MDVGRCRDFFLRAEKGRKAPSDTVSSFNCACQCCRRADAEVCLGFLYARPEAKHVDPGRIQQTLSCFSWLSFHAQRTELAHVVPIGKKERLQRPFRQKPFSSLAGHAVRLGRRGLRCGEDRRGGSDSARSCCRRDIESGNRASPSDDWDEGRGGRGLACTTCRRPVHQFEWQQLTYKCMVRVAPGACAWYLARHATVRSLPL